MINFTIAGGPNLGWALTFTGSQNEYLIKNEKDSVLMEKFVVENSERISIARKTSFIKALSFCIRSEMYMERCLDDLFIPQECFLNLKNRIVYSLGIHDEVQKWLVLNVSECGDSVNVQDRSKNIGSTRWTSSQGFFFTVEDLEKYREAMFEIDKECEV